MYIGKHEKKLVNLALILLIIDTISIFVMTITEQTYSLGEYLPIKTVKGYMFFATDVILLVLLVNLQSKLDERKIYYPFYITFIILFIIFIVEIINPDILNVFHRNTSYYEMHGRLRMLTSEASNTSTLIILYFVLALYYSNYIIKRKIISAILVGMLILLLLFSSSKGLIVTIIASLSIIMIFKTKMKRKYKVILMIAFGISLTYFIPMIINMFSQDIYEYTSTVTRFYCIANAMILSLSYPIGLGNGLYLPMYIQALSNNYNKLESFSPNMNLNEIYSYVNAVDDTNIGAKSGIFQYAIYWGILGTIYFLKFLYDLYKEVKNKVNIGSTMLQFGLLFLFISITFFIDFDCKYEVFTFISVIIYEINKKEKKKPVEDGL